MNEREKLHEKEEESLALHYDSSHSSKNEIRILGENPPIRGIVTHLSIGRKRPYPGFTYVPSRRHTRATIEIERA